MSLRPALCTSPWWWRIVEGEFFLPNTDISESEIPTKQKNIT